MNKRTAAKTVWLLLAVGCFVMGTLSLVGLFTRPQPGGRYIFGIGWLLIGAGWIARYRLAERNWQRETEETRCGQEDEAREER